MSIETNQAVNEYWNEHFTNRGVCGLCGNSGTVDTRYSAKNPQGSPVGIKTFCFCPNGQVNRTLDTQAKDDWPEEVNESEATND